MVGYRAVYGFAVELQWCEEQVEFPRVGIAFGSGTRDGTGKVFAAVFARLAYA
jgi:hypothetical protein